MTGVQTCALPICVGFNNFNDFPEVPGIYEADLDVRINKDGVAMVVANSFTFKKSLTGK